MPEATAESIQDWAFEMARAGVPVFPIHGVMNDLCSCGNPKCGSPGKHPRTPKGFKDATTDEKQIAAWWKLWPTANLAVATGGALQLLVVDCDPRNGGPTTFAELRILFPTIPADAILVRTGGGGLHVYLKYGGGKIPSHLAKGIDLKGEGGYVVAPPSIHASGRRYEFEATGL